MLCKVGGWGVMLEYHHWSLLQSDTFAGCYSVLYLIVLPILVLSGNHETSLPPLQRIMPLESAQELFPAPTRSFPGLSTTPAVSCSDVSVAATTTAPASSSVTFRCSNRLHPYIVRPYRPEDRPVLYSLFRSILLARVGLPESALPPELADLPGDR